MAEYLRYKIPKTITDASSSIPIGSPIGNTQVYILDQYLQPVPIGITGEIYIGGDGLAHGYYNRPELTQEKFIPNPFSEDLQAKLYKTGDMARYLVDGNIEFIGRVDHQVKLRGFRIELGEIESILRRHPAINNAILVINKNQSNDKNLIAYIKYNQNKSPTASELRNYLKQKLPDYMIPEFFVLLDQFPLTSNGKIDQGALPSPDKSSLKPELIYTPPRSVIEKKLVNIWQEVLKIDRVGIYDNFFAIGGHSLTAVRLLTRIEQELGKQLHINSLWFEAGSIEEQAKKLKQFEQTYKPSPIILIARGENNKCPIFCIHTIGGGNLFHYDELASQLKHNRSIYGLQAKGVDGLGKPDISVEAMASYCIQNMQKIQATGPYLLCGFSSGGTVAYEMARQLQSQGEQVKKLFMLDTFSPLYPRPLYKRILKWWQLIQAQAYREIQERVYHWSLTHLGMQKKRQLKALGESHRWGLWNYKSHTYQGDIIFFEASDISGLTAPAHTGWQKLLQGQLEIEVVPGTHGKMLAKSNVVTLAQCIDTHLSKL